MGELKHAIRRIVTYAAGEGTCGYLLSDEQIEEIAGEAHEYAKGLAAAEWERFADFADKHYAAYPVVNPTANHLNPFGDLIRKEAR